MSNKVSPAGNVPDHRRIVDHYERCFLQYGTTPKGVDWPNLDDLITRYDVMLALIDGDAGPASLLDLGCGYGLLLDHIADRGMTPAIAYSGIDLSAPMIDAARTRWPGKDFRLHDILENPLPDASFDYVVMNGVLTERVGLEYSQMEALAERLIRAAWGISRKGIAFNVMSKHVDWERDDLFHWPFDAMAAAVRSACSRHLTIRADYGLHEYTVYVHRNPRRRP